MIHSTGIPICVNFGIPAERAQKLIVDVVREDWIKLTSKQMGKDMTLGTIYEKILKSDLPEHEKCFLCTHIAQNWEIFEIREIFLANDAYGFMQKLGLG